MPSCGLEDALLMFIGCLVIAEVTLLRPLLEPRTSTPKPPAVRLPMKLCNPITTAVNMDRFMTICCSITGSIIALVWSAFFKFCERDATCTIVAIQTLNAVSPWETKSKRTDILTRALRLAI
jgi:hypothetical protein